MKRQVHGKGEHAEFAAVYDGARTLTPFKTEDAIAACRVEAGDVVIAEFNIRRTRPAPERSVVYCELRRVAQLFAGPGVMRERP